MKSIDFIKNAPTENHVELAAHEDRLSVIQSIRTISLGVVLLGTLVFQHSQPEFLNPDVWVPVYITLAIGFFLNTILLVVINKYKNTWLVNSVFFAFDAGIVTALIYFTGANQSVFLFLYLVYIILCGLVYGRRGAILMSLWTSSLFSLLLILGPDLESKSLYFAIGLNNISFFTVALLSGFLSDQINFMGGALEDRGREISALKDFNQLIVESAGTGFLVLDNELNITHSNPSACKILTDFKLIGKNLRLILPELTKELSPDKLKSLSSPVRLDEVFYNYKEEKLIIESMATVLKDTHESPVGFVIMFQDHTEIKRYRRKMDFLY